MPNATNILAQLGEDVKLVGLRRKLTTEQVSKRVSISRSTLWLVKKGTSSIAIGTYLQVLFVLCLEKNLQNIVNDNIL